MEWIISIIGALISAFIAIIFVIWMEKLRKPQLFLKESTTRTNDYGENGGRPARFLRVCELYIENRDLPSYFRWCMSRNAAVHCYGYITFYKENGERAINNQMPIKWAKLPGLEIYPGGTKIEHSLYETLYMDVHPGEKETLEVAVRLDNESDCYGWNNESYYHLWRHPAWKLIGPNTYFVNVKVVSAGLRCEDLFKLHIGENPDDFKLEHAEKIDKDGIIEYWKI